jgi:hypothetical protein
MQTVPVLCLSLPVHANFACRARKQTCMQACMRGLNVHGLQSMRRLEWVDACVQLAENA